MALNNTLSRHDVKVEWRGLSKEYFQEQEDRKEEIEMDNRAWEYWSRLEAKKSYIQKEKRKEALVNWITLKPIIPLLASSTTEIGTDENSARRICLLHMQGMNSETFEYNCPLIHWEEGVCEENYLMMEKDDKGKYFISTLAEREARERKMIGIHKFISSGLKEEPVFLGEGTDPYKYKIGDLF
jgi:hypothetical protein